MAGIGVMPASPARIAVSRAEGDLVDAADFDAFYASTVRRLIGHLYAMTGDLAEAQDVVQEAFARAWDARDTLTTARNPEAWVRTVAWRLAVSRWRKARNAAVAWRRHGPPPDQDEPSLDTPALVTALRLLPDEQRRAIVLHHLCDLSVDQVASETGVPVGTVKARLSRGRAALLAHLTVDDLPGAPAPAPATPTIPAIPTTNATANTSRRTPLTIKEVPRG